MEVIEAIHSRRSIGRMGPETPQRETIEELLDAAVQAPNHRETLPWRFFVLSGDARVKFGEVVADSIQPSLGDLDETRREAVLAAERAKPLRAPLLIVVGVKHPPSEKIVPSEDLQSCAAAIQNLLLAAHSRGLGAQWRTGSGAYSQTVKESFGLTAEDEIAGIVYLGYPDAEYVASMAERNRGYAELTEWRDG